MRTSVLGSSEEELIKTLPSTANAMYSVDLSTANSWNFSAKRSGPPSDAFAENERCPVGYAQDWFGQLSCQWYVEYTVPSPLTISNTSISPSSGSQDWSCGISQCAGHKPCPRPPPPAPGSFADIHTRYVPSRAFHAALLRVLTAPVTHPLLALPGAPTRRDVSTKLPFSTLTISETQSADRHSAPLDRAWVINGKSSHPGADILEQTTDQRDRFNASPSNSSRHSTENSAESSQKPPYATAAAATAHNATLGAILVAFRLSGCGIRKKN